MKENKELRERRERRPLPRKEIERFERCLEESGYKAKFEALEKQVAELLIKLNGDKVES